MDSKLAAATKTLAEKNLLLKPAQDKVAADAKVIATAEKALTDASPIYSDAAYTMLKALRLVRKANEAAILAK